MAEEAATEAQEARRPVAAEEPQLERREKAVEVACHLHSDSLHRTYSFLSDWRHLECSTFDLVRYCVHRLHEGDASATVVVAVEAVVVVAAVPEDDADVVGLTVEDRLDGADAQGREDPNRAITVAVR